MFHTYVEMVVAEPEHPSLFVNCVFFSFRLG